tara:strand:+ start:67046 stop:67234 length:189 start_codon:yes stop_codon:yes gene_type:complete
MGKETIKSGEPPKTFNTSLGPVGGLIRGKQWSSHGNKTYKYTPKIKDIKSKRHFKKKKPKGS